MGHADEHQLAAYSVGILSPTERKKLAAHLEGCESCTTVAGRYGQVIESLAVWNRPPAEILQAGRRVVTQRIRLHGLIGQLMADPALRRQAAVDPEAVLAAHGMQATPALVAAFKLLTSEAQPAMSLELDERIAKILQLLE